MRGIDFLREVGVRVHVKKYHFNQSVCLLFDLDICRYLRLNNEVSSGFLFQFYNIDIFSLLTQYVFARWRAEEGVLLYIYIHNCVGITRQNRLTIGRP